MRMTTALPFPLLLFAAVLLLFTTNGKGKITTWGQVLAVTGILSVLLLASLPSAASFGTASIQRPSSKLPKMGVFLPPVELGNLPVVGIAAGGNNGAHVLGYNDQLRRGDGVFVPSQAGQTTEMGSFLPPLNLGQSVLFVAAGAGHYVDFELGYGAVDGHPWTSFVPPLPISQDYPAVELDGPVFAVALGAKFTCALVEGVDLKKLWCWGDNSQHQLGNSGDGRVPCLVDLGDTPVHFVATGEMHTCVIVGDAPFELKCWGDSVSGYVDTNGNPAHPPLPVSENYPAVEFGGNTTVLSVSAGRDFTCAVLSSPTLGVHFKCFGRNDVGQLGYGDTKFRWGPDDLPVPVGGGRTVASVRCGSMHACALFTDASLFCWGQTGNGATGDIGVKPPAYSSVPVDLGWRVSETCGCKGECDCPSEDGKGKDSGKGSSTGSDDGSDDGSGTGPDCHHSHKKSRKAEWEADAAASRAGTLAPPASPEALPNARTVIYAAALGSIGVVVCVLCPFLYFRYRRPPTKAGRGSAFWNSLSTGPDSIVSSNDAGATTVSASLVPPGTAPSSAAIVADATRPANESFSLRRRTSPLSSLESGDPAPSLGTKENGREGFQAPPLFLTV
ncbi:regulator of chromosome condensation 1/beta-lactamase-inhibitor protein II, partial [Baffinella frigidus]